MENSEKVSLLDSRFKFAIFFLVLAFLLLVIALILMPTAKFTNEFNRHLGDGFWALNHYGVQDTLFNSTSLDDQAIINGWLSHPFLQVFVALLFLIFLCPIFLICGVFLLTRWWIKTRI